MDSRLLPDLPSHVLASLPINSIQYPHVHHTQSACVCIVQFGYARMRLCSTLTRSMMYQLSMACTLMGKIFNVKILYTFLILFFLQKILLLLLLQPYSVFQASSNRLQAHSSRLLMCNFLAQVICSGCQCRPTSK